jgi:hypothetical protein
LADSITLRDALTKMTINKIDLNKLQSYSGKVTQSFEQLIYTLMIKEYGDLGKFTPIAGAGGDSGVEFYLDLPNGERWGWQCKWYGDNGRLRQSNRTGSIEDSLSTACTNHHNLTKWFLCLRTDLTVDLKTRSGILKKGEREWFEKILPQKVPSNQTVEIAFIGETEIVNYISDAKNIGIRNFFFGELEFNQSWFSRNFYDSFEQVKSKYEPELHTTDEFTQSIIDFKLLNPEYNLILQKYKDELENLKKDIYDKKNGFHEVSTHDEADREAKERGFLLFSEFNKHCLSAFQILNDIGKFLSEYDINSLATLNFESNYQIFHKYLDRLNEFVYTGDDSFYRPAKTIYHSIRNFFRELERFVRNYTHTIDNEIHFIAKPAEGKTHTSCDIAYKRIENGLPAIFLTGNKFNHESDLEQTILKRLDLPGLYSFDDFITSLEIYGSLRKVRIPIIIDGLNETVFNKLFSDIWRTHLPSLISKIKRCQNIVLITTCRTSYQDEVWGDSDSKTLYYLYGFDGYEVTKQAIERYFRRYLIRADLNFSNLDSFKKPIFLKLYCEIKNPQWRQGIETEVTIDDDSSNELFETYFNQINISVSLKSHLVRRNELFIQSSLSKIAKYLWENNVREIEIDTYYNLIDGTTPYNSETSRGDILINEGLIITRDYRSNYEFVSITYELMAGYLVSNYLIKNLSEQEFMPGSEFHQKIGAENERHPLYENIAEELALIFPKEKGKKLHELYSKKDDNYIHSISVNSLWKLQPKYITNQDVDLVSNYFRSSQQNRNYIIARSRDTVTSTKHPLNMHFLDNELLKLDVWERDLSWTEYVRESAYELIPYVEEFEKQCKTGRIESELNEAKLHLAAIYLQWFLTSTHRHLRDYTTRALYFYGRKFPLYFIKNVISSLNCNDPYVWERTLAALYGVCMAEHHHTDFQENFLPEITGVLYKLIFSEDATNYTTHILAKDYARGCIRIALIYHPELLNSAQIERITPSYQKPQNEPPLLQDEEDSTYRSPLNMDFSNYTIGYIVEGGHSYNNPPEKKMVRRQILHRIENLGWSEGRFKSIDERLSRNHFSRNERPPIERYGKKYSRIAFFEIAGYRDDLGLLSKDFQYFRTVNTDLDPSFPDDVKTPRLVSENLLGDRNSSLEEWLKTEDFPDIEPYLQPVLNDKQFVCMDGFIMQNDEKIYRERFSFVRSFLVSEDMFLPLLNRIQNQPLSGRWLPEKHENTNAFAGEYYLFEEATHSNKTLLEFVISSSEKTVKIGEEGYYPEIELIELEDGSLSFRNSYPKSKKITVQTKDKFEVLMPVMVYHSPADNKEINKASSTTTLAKEIAMDLGLVMKGQSFDLFDATGLLACKNIAYYENSDNTHSMVYLRKDLLDKYLKKHKLKFFWAIWGEREPSIGYRRSKRRSSDEKDEKDDYFTFQKIFEYH